MEIIFIKELQVLLFEKNWRGEHDEMAFLRFR